MTFGIAAGAGIAVPIPGAADPVRRFQQLDRQSKAVAQAVQLIKAGKTGADDQRVEVVGLPGRAPIECVSSSGMKAPGVIVSRIGFRGS